MKLRWSFRAANDRGPQAESRVLFEAPNKEATHQGGFFIFHLIYDLNLRNCVTNSSR